MLVTLDIETLPTNNQLVIDEFKKGIKAPGNYTKPETIQKWMEENSTQALEDMIAKTSFDGLYGSIACIAWSFDDDEVISSQAGMNEKEVIESLYKYLTDSASHIEFEFCGHNLAGFDLPFLKHRSMILGIKPPKGLLTAMNSKPWESCIKDTMLMWSADPQKRVSMDKLCKALGIEGKGDFDGSMVAKTWETDKQKVIDYCKDDVSRTRQIYKCLTWS